MTQAQNLANSGELEDAINAAAKVKKGRALYAAAQSAIKNWTEEKQTIEDRPILIRAQNLAAIGSLSAAIDVAAQIGPGRALYEEARTSIAIWAREREYIWSLRSPAIAEDDSYSDGSYDSYTEESSYEDSYSDEF